MRMDENRLNEQNNQTGQKGPSCQEVKEVPAGTSDLKVCADQYHHYQEDIVLMAATEGSYVSTRFNFSSEEMYGATLGIDTECYKDVQNKKMSADTSLSVMNYEFAHLNLYADEEALCFSIPELFLENMYIENEDVVSQYNSSIWTDVTGYSDMEDFSIDFFADEEERLSLREWKDMAGFAERYSKDLEACREKMVLEKAKKGFYRIVLPAGEMDDLLWDMMESYESLYTMADEMIWWEAYDRGFRGMFPSFSGRGKKHRQDAG